MLAAFIAQIFCVSIVCVTAIKWHNPDVETSFLGIIGSMSMGAAGFMVLHFNQKNIEKNQADAAKVLAEKVEDTAERLATKVEDTAGSVATTVLSTAAKLDKNNSQAFAAQTKELVQAMGEKTESIINEVKSPS